MIYPYLVLHMRSLGLSMEEVSTGRFLCCTPTLSSTCTLLASLWRRSVLGDSDDLPLSCPPHALSWPLCGGGQYWEILKIYPYLVHHMRSLGLSVEDVSTGSF